MPAGHMRDVLKIDLDFQISPDKNGSQDMLWELKVADMVLNT